MVERVEVEARRGADVRERKAAGERRAGKSLREEKRRRWKKYSGSAKTCVSAAPERMRVVASVYEVALSARK